MKTRTTARRGRKPNSEAPDKARADAIIGRTVWQLLWWGYSLRRQVAPKVAKQAKALLGRHKGPASWEAGGLQYEVSQCGSRKERARNIWAVWVRGPHLGKQTGVDIGFSKCLWDSDLGGAPAVLWSKCPRPRRRTTAHAVP